MPRNWLDRLKMLGQMVLLLAFSWFVWTNLIAPRTRLEGLGPILAEAAVFVATTWMVSAFVVIWLYMLVAYRSEPGEIVRLSLWSAAPAMWLPPALILMSALTPGPMLLGLILLINVTSLLVLRWTRVRGRAFSAPLFRSSLPSLGGALAIQSGILLLWLDYPFLGASLFFAASAILTAVSIVAGAYQLRKEPALPSSALSPAVAFVLALALTVTSIQVSSGWEGSGAALTSARSILRRLWHPPQAPEEPKQAVTKLYMPQPSDDAPRDPKALGNGGFPGVVLRTRRKEQKQLVVPQRSGEEGRAQALKRPLHIPFTGDYWLYQAFLAPLAFPPNQSAIRFGSPLDLSFHTADFRPMRMEAHQRLNPPITLDCCRSIQLVISHGGLSGPLAVDLSAIDSTRPVFRPGREIWLGTAAVGPEPSETLTFEVPPNAGYRRCDDLEAVFRLQEYNGLEAAAESHHVAVEEIVLVP